MPPTAGTFPTNTPLFFVLLLAVILTVVGLTYFPVVSLGLFKTVQTLLERVGAHYMVICAKPPEPSVTRTTKESAADWPGFG